MIRQWISGSQNIGAKELLLIFPDTLVSGILHSDLLVS
jgi:hypothetical protein